MIPQPFFTQKDKNLRLIGWWLFIVAALVFMMILVGGATRLTESGLSIVEWKPVSGILPPLSDDAWQQEFESYQQYPEYQLVNRGMSLVDFKAIYWWEYGHRLLGRLIGLAFAVPLLYFLAKKMVPSDLKLRLFGILALGAAQGLLGWYMVQSGLIHEPAVSHLRLLAHLLLALAVLSALLWTAWQVLHAPSIENAKIPGLERYLIVVLVLVLMQISYGALTAGLDAGRIFNAWPVLHRWFGSLGVWREALGYRNIIDNPVIVQFIHRLLGYFILVLAQAPLLFAYVKTSPACVRMLGAGLSGLVLAQVALGITTLLLEVPVAFGVLHQGFGIALFLYILFFIFALKGERYGQ